jgi:hypothetical protein
MSERMTLDPEFRQACHDLGYPGSHEDALTALVQLVEFMKDRVASGDITLEQSKAICRDVREATFPLERATLADATPDEFLLICAACYGVIAVIEEDPSHAATLAGEVAS